jgi:hypothetical protein
MNKNTLRSIGAVVAGAIVGVILSTGTDAVMRAFGFFTEGGPPSGGGPFVFATIYRTVYGVASAYIAARLAPNRPMMHALVLGVLGIVAGAEGAGAMWSRLPALGSRWYPIALIVLALPTAWWGGKLRLLQLDGRVDD